jgi:hypothetical protein
LSHSFNNMKDSALGFITVPTTIKKKVLFGCQSSQFSKKS